jgi:transglutaminase-like putative cysteine protease
MKLDVSHVTRYAYDHPVRMSTQYLRLTPRESRNQKVLDWRLDAPMPATRTKDGFGNVLHVLTLDKPTTEIVVRASGTVETQAGQHDDTDLPLPPLLFTRPTPLTQIGPALAAFAEKFRNRAHSPGGVADLAAAVLKRMPYRPGDTHAASSAVQAFALGSGVCQDHTHVFVACCRYLGVPARYVSGYVYVKDSVEHISTHAWAEAWVLDRWRSFDISNRKSAGEEHIKLAIGADYLDACPIRGTRVGGGAETMRAEAAVSQSSQ